jgi:energy-coupling factor transport system ATP-binding protein
LTILIAEHRLERVLPYVDRLICLDEGRMTVDGPVREAVLQAPGLPPLLQLGRQLGWRPLPLTVKEGRRFARQAVRQGPGEKEKEYSAVHQSPPPLLQAEGIHFAYGRQTALQGISLSLRPGEAVALMGRNGSGKSTFLKCLVGLLSPAQGEVWLNGRSTQRRDVADICREVAYLPQDPDDLLFADSVAEELAVTLRNHGLDTGQDGINTLLARLGLAEVAVAYPRDLSVGQRQRVALGAIMITEPQLLLLDEPTRGLDYQAKQSLVALWRQWLTAGMGLLLVTHDVELVAMIADRVMILSQGHVVAAGKTADILNASPLFAPQMARLFPGFGWLTLDDALAGLKR